MAYEQKPGQGSLFQNRKKGTNEKAPNMVGTALLAHEDQLIEVEISGWTRESPKAGKWLSLSVKVKNVRSTSDRDMDSAFN